MKPASLKQTVNNKPKTIFFKAPGPPIGCAYTWLRPYHRLWRLRRNADVRDAGSVPARMKRWGQADELASLLSTCGRRGYRLRRLMLRRQRKMQRLTDFEFDLVANVDVFAQELPGVFASLPDSFPAEGKP